MHGREWEFIRIECLLGETHHVAGILADGIKHNGIFIYGMRVGIFMTLILDRIATIFRILFCL